MAPQITQAQVISCFEELISNRPNINTYKTIFDKYAPVHLQQIPPLKIISNTGSSNRIIEQRELEDEFYEEKFVPSPDLLLNYQQTFIKSLRGEQPFALNNHKLQNLYHPSHQATTNPFAGKQNHSLEPTTQSYMNISPQYNYQPPRAQNKHIFVEEREQVILKELKDKQKSGLEMSIPVIEKSLMENEIRSLEMKNIAVENLGRLSSWKQKREKIQGKLGKGTAK